MRTLNLVDFFKILLKLDFVRGQYDTGFWTSDDAERVRQGLHTSERVVNNSTDSSGTFRSSWVSMNIFP